MEGVMASEAQIEANRRNAQRSTGPRSPEGKAAASRNAVRHGLTSAQLILFDERPDDFERFYDDLRTAHAPADAAEDGLVERIAMVSWRLRRVWRAEAAAINQEALAIARRRARAAAQTAIAEELTAHPPEGKAMTPDEVARAAAAGAYALSDEELEASVAAEGADADAAPAPGLGDIAIWPDRLAQLSRHEAALERALHRATMALERSQATRRAMAIAAAKAAAAELALERRAAEAKAAMARESAAHEPPAASPARPGASPLTLAALEANIEIAKRSQFHRGDDVSMPLILSGARSA
jgi:hypothetical protein